jgi:hypothetical protein
MNHENRKKMVEQSKTNRTVTWLRLALERPLESIRTLEYMRVVFFVPPGVEERVPPRADARGMLPE